MYGCLCTRTRWQTFNNVTVKPLPVIKNMPVGAPLPPDSGATVGAMTITK